MRGSKRSPASAVVGAIKVLAFLAATQILLEVVVFTALAALSARLWSRYDGRGLNLPWFLSSGLASLGVTLLVCFAFLEWIDHERWAHIRLRARHGLRLFVAGLVIAAVVVLLLTAIAVAANAVQVDFRPDPFLPAVSYVLAVLAGGFALVLQEELVYRGYLLRTLEASVQPSVAVVATSLIFGLFHLTRAHVSIPGVLTIFVMGCLLAVVCIRTDSLWPSIGLHFGWNSSLYLLDFPVSGTTYPNPLLDLQYLNHSWIVGSAFGPEDSILVTVVIALLLGAALAWLPKRGGPPDAAGVDAVK